MRCVKSLLVLCFFASSLFADNVSVETPIPIWERPDYIVESPDVITVKMSGKNVPAEIVGEHLVAPDGFITLGQYGRVKVDGLNTAECSEAIGSHLTQSDADAFEPDSFDITVRVFASNSKEYHVVLEDASGGEQSITFTYTGHETLFTAIESMNGLSPECSSALRILRAVKKGKPVEMMTVNYDSIVKDSTNDVALKSGDIIVIRHNFRGEDLRPDGPVHSVSCMPVELTERTVHVVPGEKPKRIARTVFFDGKQFMLQQFVGLNGALTFDNGLLGGLVRQLKDEVSISMLVCGKEMTDGCWLILFGTEDAVEELHAMFKEIADSTTE